MKRVSIIIPVHNAARYIRKCINSIANQDYPSIEIIAVDDYSSDSSVEVLESIKRGVEDNKRKKDKNGKKAREIELKIIPLSENHGASYARWRGLSEVSGDYVMFVDADDYLAPRSITDLVKAIEETEADVVEGAIVRVLGNNGIYRSARPRIPKVIEHQELMDNYFISFFGKPKITLGLCGKLYKKSLLDRSGIEPNGYRFGEDAITSLSIFPHINRYQIISEAVYYYRYGGMTSKYKPYLYEELKTLFRYRLKVLSQYNYPEVEKALYRETTDHFLSTLKNMFRAGIPYGKIEEFYRKELETGELDEFVLKTDISSERDTNIEKLYNSVKNKKVDEDLLRRVEVSSRPGLKERLRDFFFRVFGPVL